MLIHSSVCPPEPQAHGTCAGLACYLSTHPRTRPTEVLQAWTISKPGCWPGALPSLFSLCPGPTTRGNPQICSTCLDPDPHTPHWCNAPALCLQAHIFRLPGAGAALLLCLITALTHAFVESYTCCCRTSNSSLYLSNLSETDSKIKINLQNVYLKYKPLFIWCILMQIKHAEEITFFHFRI